MSYAAQTPVYQFPSNPVPPSAYAYPVQPESTLVLPAAETPAAPDASFVNSRVASQAVEQLVSAQLRVAGFKSAEPAALRRLEGEVIAFVERLYEEAHNYANLANRSGPLVTDLMKACGEKSLEPKDLHVCAVKSARKMERLGIRSGSLTTLLPPPPEEPQPEMLGSDDEEAPKVPATLRAMPHPLPSLPPKHTYLKTPIAPPRKTAIPSLEKKLKTAGLVQDSLKNLLLATEDTTGQEDGELFGHIVNWEATTHPRKRWKLDSGSSRWGRMES